MGHAPIFHLIAIFQGKLLRHSMGEGKETYTADKPSRGAQLVIILSKEKERGPLFLTETRKERRPLYNGVKER